MPDIDLKGDPADKDYRAHRISTAYSTQIVGTSELYDEYGNVRYVPMPSADPKDPLNLPQWRKIVAVATVCLFGALSIAAEVIIGPLYIVFVLEYAGIDPKILKSLNLNLHPGTINVDPTADLTFGRGPPLWKVALIQTLPLLVSGISTYFLMPLSIAIGRRPVLLVCGILAWAGGLGAGFSHSLNSHIVSRCVQAVGAGAVEALLPLVLQDLVFIHQRNRVLSLMGTAQGLLILSLGVAAPVIVVTLGWRFIYFLTSGVAAAAWLAMIAFMPESRWNRTEEELAGQSVQPLSAGQTRPAIDQDSYTPRSLWTNIGVFQNGFEHKQAAQSMLYTLRTMIFPNVIWVTLVNAVFVTIQIAGSRVLPSVLIANGWKFQQTGLGVVPIVVAAPFVWLLGGALADKVSNAAAKRNHGRREPEAHLLNLILPLISGVAGCLLFGFAASHALSVQWIFLMLSVLLIAIGFGTAHTVFNVYMIESYPHFAGPVLVNATSFRLILGFALSAKISDVIKSLGLMRTFMLLAGVLSMLGTLLPVMYTHGKKIRQWTAGSVKVKIDDGKLGNPA